MAACALLAAAAGCGEGERVSKGATVTAYVSAPLCPSANRKLARQGGGAGHLRVRAICLPSPRTADKLNLDTIGANARRAAEDSTTVGYIGELHPAAARFSRPILESAGIAQLSGTSGSDAMAKLLRAIRSAGDSEDLRQAVYDSVGGR